MPDHFALVILDAHRKFLSAKKCWSATEAGASVAELLMKEVVGSISVRRVLEKKAADK